MKRFIIFFMVLLTGVFSTSQMMGNTFGKDVLPVDSADSLGKTKFITGFKASQLIAPVALFGAGVVGNHISGIKEFDFGFSDRASHVRKNFYAEDVVQYFPAASFYLFKLGGAKSTHNYVDATVVLALSCAINAVTTYTIKQIAGVQRPDGIGFNSFPSGHTGTAFMGAEFLRLQYKDSSPWIGIAGYAVATTTAISRIAHNEHWFPDLLAGAGVGILSSKVAYWVYPWFKEKVVQKIFKPKNKVEFVGLPYYSGESGGISLAMSF